MLKVNLASMATIGETLIVVLSRLPFSIRGIGALILGVLLAKWFWILFAPMAIFTAVTPGQSESPEAGKIFGVTQVAEIARPGTALANVQLLGVFTASAGKPGFAVMKLEDKRQLGITEGEEVSGGTKLVSVYADYVMLERGGVKQRVNLENKYSASPNRITSSTPNKNKPAAPAFSASALPDIIKNDPSLAEPIRDIQKRMRQSRDN